MAVSGHSVQDNVTWRWNQSGCSSRQPITVTERAGAQLPPHQGARFQGAPRPPGPGHMEAIGAKRTQMFPNVSENEWQARAQKQAGHTTKEMHFPQPVSAEAAEGLSLNRVCRAVSGHRRRGGRMGGRCSLSDPVPGRECAIRAPFPSPSPWLTHVSTPGCSLGTFRGAGKAFTNHLASLGLVTREAEMVMAFPF